MSSRRTWPEFKSTEQYGMYLLINELKVLKYLWEIITKNKALGQVVTAV